MRGRDERSGSLFSYVDLEARVRGDHPLRLIRGVANAALSDLSGTFSGLYRNFGRPSIAPEKLLRAMLLQAFCGVRSERQLMGRLEFDLLFRWFVGLGVDDAVWDHSAFSKNRDRLLEGEIAVKFLSAVLAQPRVKRLLSSEHFSVDGTLIEAWGRSRASGGGTAGIDGRTTHHAGYAVSQRCRKRIEEVFGWLKSSAGLAKIKLRGRRRVEATFTLALAAYDLIRLSKLLAAPP
jgi:transposase